MVIPMKHLTTLITILFISLLSSPSWSETLSSLDDLVLRNDTWYKKFSDVPFTGEVSGRISGVFINGKFNGPFVSYWENGQLQTKGVFADGKREGYWVYFFQGGSPLEAMTGTFKDGEKISD